MLRLAAHVEHIHIALEYLSFDSLPVMRRTLFVGFLIGLARSGLAAQAPADFSGVDQFWSIVDRLSAGTEPGDSAWDRLFSTPGYAALQERERRRPALTTAFRAAFMPARRAERDSIVAAQSWTARVIRHVETLPARRPALDEFQKKLRDDDVAARAARLAGRLLPRGTVERLGRPPVAFVFFLPDGRGYPTLIVADLAEVMSKPDPAPFFAHEMMHFYWRGLSQPQASRSMTAQDSLRDAIRSLLTKIAEESAGDQFDKVDAVAMDSVSRTIHYADAQWRTYLDSYAREYAHAPADLRGLSAVLERAIGSEPHAGIAMVDSTARALPLEGRPLGMFMARAIRRELGDAVFASVVGDVAGYLDAYNRAARRTACSCPVIAYRFPPSTSK
jgi:hypothetical protein